MDAVILRLETMIVLDLLFITGMIVYHALRDNKE